MDDLARGLRAVDVGRWLMQWLIWLLVYVWLVLVVGFVGAYFGQFLGKTMQHWAWIAGAVLALVGVPLGWVNLGKGLDISRPSWWPTRGPGDSKREKAVERRDPQRPLWVTENGVFAGIIALVLGGFIGFMLMSSWFSISMSPLAPARWSESVTYRDDTTETHPELDDHEQHPGGLTTEHPLPIILFLAPPITLSLVAFVWGGFFIKGSVNKPQKKKSRNRGSAKRRKRDTPRADSTPGTVTTPEVVGQGGVPYDIAERPMPEGDDPDSLLPCQVGPYIRESFKPPQGIQQSSYATYCAGEKEVFVELGICDDADAAQGGLETARNEMTADGIAIRAWSIGTEPGFLMAGGAFMAWTRGGYYFSVHAKGGEDDLEQFMNSFPY